MYMAFNLLLDNHIDAIERKIPVGQNKLMFGLTHNDNNIDILIEKLQ